MITIERDGNKVKLRLNPTMFDGKVANFYWECGNDWYASLLADKMKLALQEGIKAIRQEAYNAGWKDRGAKRKKETWFTSWL